MKNNYFKWILNLSFFETPNSYFISFEEVILSSLVKIIELHKVSEVENISQWNSNIFQTPFSFLMEEVMSSSLQGFVFEKNLNSWRSKCKMKVWESPFIPSHVTFKSFEFHSINHTTIKQSIYLL